MWCPQLEHAEQFAFVLLGYIYCDRRAWCWEGACRQMIMPSIANLDFHSRNALTIGNTPYMYIWLGRADMGNRAFVVVCAEPRRIT